MPHAVNPPGYENDELLELAKEGDVGEGGLNLNEFLNVANDEELQPGDKDVNAQDYADISEDDLIEDLEGPGHVTYLTNGSVTQSKQGLGNAQTKEVDDDDLFGDSHGDEDLFGAPSSPTAEDGLNGLTQDSHLPQAPSTHPPPGQDDVPSSSPTLHDLSFTHDLSATASQGKPLFQEIDYSVGAGGEDEDEVREQRALFAQAGRYRERAQGHPLGELPDAPQTNDELFALIWPQFEADKPPRFGDLLPGKRAFYISKTALRPPKPLQPTKISLDVLPDQERSFRLPSTASQDTRQIRAVQNGVVEIVGFEAEEETSADEWELDTIDEGEPVGGLTLQDLSVLCEDWEIPALDTVPALEGSINGIRSVGGSEHGSEDDWDVGTDQRPTKKRKMAHACDDAFSISHRSYMAFDDPEQATARLARKVALDLNDPHLLLDVQHPDVTLKRVRKLGGDFKRDANGSLRSDLSWRYNISNDEAYARLKENQQHKVRSTLGNLAIEHSLPALKLQYPFYRVKLTPREARAHHRQGLSFVPGQVVEFSKAKHVKKKHLKGKDVQEVFKTSHDLSMGDNSNVLLLEYSEEYPVMLSNFGMGNRMINYYRRKDMEDNARPKHDIGETVVLLPQDKSPFSLFGQVDPGHIVPTLQNGMFRAPVFKHEPRSTDFLVVRNKTGVGGPRYYMRNVENLYVVGQQLPSVEVPGIHSRKVTEASKKRLKAITYRMVNHRKPVTHANVQAHLPGSDTAQNRAKLKEFMHYEKEKGTEEGVWKPEKGKLVPDSATIRSWIKPEDVSLLDSMQIGHRQLQDAGYNKDDRDAEGGSDEEREGASIDEQLAPWNTSKNFLQACQGKAMLQLHGEGDPSGSGVALSFLKTSMKGGFRPIGQSVQDKIDAKALKENGGHSYNVARQQKAYEDYVRDVWTKQTKNLSSTIEPDDNDKDIDHQEESNASFGREASASAFGRRDDETASQFSRFSTSSQRNKVLKITRKMVDKYGRQECTEEIIHDPKVIREYVKRRRTAEVDALPLDQLVPTGDPEIDRLIQKRLQDGFVRISRNMDRRSAREKAKGILPSTAVDSPESPNAPAGAGGSKGTGTQRKCANCGQVGHIKTNKKLCPMLNGTMKQEEGFGESAFASVAGP